MLLLEKLIVPNILIFLILAAGKFLCKHSNILQVFRHSSLCPPVLPDSVLNSDPLLSDPIGGTIKSGSLGQLLSLFYELLKGFKYIFLHNPQNNPVKLEFSHFPEEKD